MERSAISPGTPTFLSPTLFQEGECARTVGTTCMTPLKNFVSMSGQNVRDDRDTEL
jgi:hypothetical protein